MISPEQARQNIAGNLQRILKERGITQTRLAEIAGQPLMTINNMVRGQKEPRIGILASVAEALGVSIDRLVAPPPSPAIPRSQRMSAENVPAHA